MSFNGGGGGSSWSYAAGVRDPLASRFWAFRSEDDGDDNVSLAGSPGETVEYEPLALLRSLDELVDDLGVDSVE